MFNSKVYHPGNIESLTRDHCGENLNRGPSQELDRASVDYKHVF